MKLNAQAKRIRKKYTSITEYAGTAEDGFNVWLTVNNQLFCVTRQPCDTQQDAEWFRDRLAYALATMVGELEKK